MEAKSCANCRLHRAERRPKVVGEMFDTVVEFADEDETVYHCTVTNRLIGTTPIVCDRYEEPQSVKKQLDEWEARWQARQAGRPDRDEER